MNKNEVSALVAVIMAAYPTQYMKFGHMEVKRLVEVWNMVLKDYPYRIGQEAVKLYLANDDKGFPPSPGQIVGCIAKIRKQPEDGLTESQAWALVYRAIGNSAYHAEEEFASLPPICAMAVGGPENLKAWGGIDAGSLPVIQSQFLRSYRQAVERKMEMEKMPMSVKEMIAGMKFDGRISEMRTGIEMEME